MLSNVQNGTTVLARQVGRGRWSSKPGCMPFLQQCCTLRCGKAVGSQAGSVPVSWFSVSSRSKAGHCCWVGAVAPRADHACGKLPVMELLHRSMYRRRLQSTGGGGRSVDATGTAPIAQQVPESTPGTRSPEQAIRGRPLFRQAAGESQVTNRKVSQAF